MLSALASADRLLNYSSTMHGDVQTTVDGTISGSLSLLNLLKYPTLSILSLIDTVWSNIIERERSFEREGKWEGRSGQSWTIGEVL